MARGTHKGAPSVRADYLRGDPSEQGPLTRGRLELEEEGLHFTIPGGPELRIELEELEALTVSGRSPYERPRRHARGTMLVAARRNQSVEVWEFAVERKAGATLRDRIHRELHARGLRRPPLPFVEQLVGPLESPAEESHAPVAAGDGSTGEKRSLWRTIARPRVALLALLIAAVVAAEILIALSLIS
jgi:hypothetical protein